MQNENLGKTGVDVISGFEGTILAYIQYYTGCNQYLLVPKVDKDGKAREGEWYDESRVKIKGRKAQLLKPEPAKPVAVTGFDTSPKPNVK